MGKGAGNQLKTCEPEDKTYWGQASALLIVVLWITGLNYVLCKNPYNCIPVAPFSPAQHSVWEQLEMEKTVGKESPLLSNDSVFQTSPPDVRFSLCSFHPWEGGLKYKVETLLLEEFCSFPKDSMTSICCHYLFALASISSTFLLFGTANCFCFKHFCLSFLILHNFPLFHWSHIGAITNHSLGSDHHYSFSSPFCSPNVSLLFVLVFVLVT